ncbi:hypothetical protein D0809_01785 [Flavobacterium circumlabens]|uniref:Uncharacterized protein n=1 Tax=Flavobacterium circumlabens TaxID=2133765 RepID=A0A4Y7UIS5_9FLAO|nr:hypothetical protein D0809_01785 [Flavobacterium circumlabens]
MQSWQGWQSLSANPCQLVWRFFEDFCDSRKPLFNKVFGVFNLFCNGVLRVFANWHIWAKKKQYVLGTAFRLL